jgi:hypothetical protein
MRRLALLLAGLLDAATVTPSLASGPRLQRELLVFSYDGPGPALLSVDGYVEAKGRPGYFADVTGGVHDGHLVPYFADVLELGEPAGPPHVYGAAGSHDLCAAPAITCTTTPGSSRLRFTVGSIMGRSEATIHARYFLALEGTSLHAETVGIGWKVQRRTAGISRVAGGGTGAHALGSYVEAMPSASLPGGRRGSIAIAVPPCDELGAGTVTLTGAAQPDQRTCPTSAFADAAARATSWTLSGPAAGASEYRTRLLVIDL